MKKLIIIIFTLTSLLFFSCSNKNRHIGEWIGGENSKKFSLILDKEGTAKMAFENKVISSQKEEISGKKQEFLYKIDYSKEPIWLDLVFKLTEGESVTETTQKGIVRFITDTKIEFRLNMDPEGERFSNFDPQDQVHTRVFEKTIH